MLKNEHQNQVPAIDSAPVLGYARRAREPRRGWRGLVLLSCLGIVLLGAILQAGIIRGHGAFVCDRCGARSHARWLTFYGLGGEYERKIQASSFATWMERTLQRPCTHNWLFADGGEDRLFGGLWRGHGHGLGLHGVMLFIDWNPGVGEILEKRRRDDPNFIKLLQQAMIDRDSEQGRKLWDDIQYESFKMTSEPSEPAPSNTP